MLQDILSIVRRAGQMMREAHAGAGDITSKEGRSNFVTAYDVKINLNTLRFANPMSLDVLCRLRPIYFFQTFQQLLCKCRLVDYPLLHVLTDNRITASLRLTVDNLVIG